MSQQLPQGINRQGLGAAFEADEARKSSLILHAQLLRQQHEDEAAATQFAEAARLEEHLSDLCETQGLMEKSVVHRFSAASCWAQAGDFFHAIVLCDDLLARADLPDRLRQRIAEYAQTLRDMEIDNPQKEAIRKAFAACSFGLVVAPVPASNRG